MPAEVSSWPRVVAVVPARDEAAIIGESIASLLQQDYRGDFAVIVVDDHSSDGTAAVAGRAATAAGASGRVTILSAPPLPGGWTGKLWAQHHGINHAQTLPEPPDYLLLTDADIRHAADTLTELVLRAVRDRAVFVTDGNQFMNRPGPRLVESLQIFAEIVHPDLFPPTLEHVGWERL